MSFVYDLAGHEITQLSSTGSWTRGEVYAGGRHLATYSGTGGTTYFIHADWLGTERARSNVSGGSYETCTSLPFGDWLTCSGTDVSPMHFTGKEHDNETGLDNFGARYDASSLGRFMSPDPKHINTHLSDPQSFNRYAYTRDNPVLYVDPDGKDWQTAWHDVKTFVDSTYARITVGAGFGAKVRAGPVEAKAEVAAKVSAGAPPLEKGVMEAKATLDAGIEAGRTNGPKVGESATLEGPNATLQHMDGTTTVDAPSVQQTDTIGGKSTAVSNGGNEVGLTVEGGDVVIAGGELGATKEGWSALGDAFKQALGALYTPPTTPTSPSCSASLPGKLAAKAEV